jgi:hypothetical protein
MRIDPYSNTWQVVEAHLKQRMADLRIRLEGDQPEESSIKLRAALRECKSMLELAGDRTPLVESDIEIPG